MSSDQPYVIAVIGAGPRGTSFLERLLAHLEQLTARQDLTERSSAGDQLTSQQAHQQLPTLRICVFDPAQHGPGRVWDPQQPAEYLMNTPADYPTVTPVGATLEDLPSSSCAMSFFDYAQAQHLPYQPGDFPARADYGRYLAEVYHQVSQRLGELGVLFEDRSVPVASLHRAAGSDQQRWEVATQDGQVTVADVVVLGLGHIPAQLSTARRELAEASGSAGLSYQPPAIPTENDLTRFPAKERVLVRGMGLNFFDLMIGLTQGRGGHFEETGHGMLRYHPSGAEPIICAGSRRGTPYRSKSAAPGFTQAHLPGEHFAQAELPGDEQLDFLDQLWPLIRADVQDAYAHAFPDPAAVPEEPFDLMHYAYPLAGRVFRSGAEYQQAMAHWLEADIADSVAGTANPEKMAVAALHAARLRLKALILQGRISTADRVEHIEGWFESLVEGLASGPPLIRIRQLAALAQAGVVEFLGPEPEYSVDAPSREFIAASPAVAGTQYHAQYLVEAMMPVNAVPQADSTLVRALLQLHPAEVADAEPSAGQAQSAASPTTFHSTTTPSHPVEPVKLPTTDPSLRKGFRVTGTPHRLVIPQQRSAALSGHPGPAQRAAPTQGQSAQRDQQPAPRDQQPEQAVNIFVLGLQLSSAQWGNAIAAEAGGAVDSTARTLADADAVAAAILHLVSD